MRRNSEGVDTLHADLTVALIAGKDVDEPIRRSRKNRSEVDSLLFTTFWDKVEILRGIDGPRIWAGGRSQTREQLREIYDLLRNPVAHARDYVTSREDVNRLQVMIRNLLSLRDQAAAWPPGDAADVEA